MIPVDVQGAGADAIAIYTESIAKGTAPRLAEMLALRTVPAARTTDDYFKGRGSLQQQYGEAGAARVAANLAKHGYHVKPGDTYNPTAARFPGDPQAVESRLNGGRDHIRRVAQQREDAERRRQDRVAKTGIFPGEDIIARRARELVTTGAVKTKSKRELREAAIADLKSE